MLNPATEAPGSGPTIADAPARRALRRYEETTVDVIVERYLAGDSTPTISADLGIPIRTVGYQLERRGIERRPSSVPYKHPAPGERVCALEGCDEKFTPTGYQVAQGGGRFHSRAHARAAQRVAEPEPRKCRYRHCDRIFTPWPSEAARPGHGQFCSPEHRQLHFWRADKGAAVASFVDSLKERGLWRSRAQKKWGSAWGGAEGGAPTLAERDETNVRNAAGVALDCYRRNPTVARRDVVTLVVVALEGRDVLFDQQGTRRWARDPVRRAAEKRAIRRLEAAAKLADFADTLLAREFG